MDRYTCVCIYIYIYYTYMHTYIYIYILCYTAYAYNLLQTRREARRPAAEHRALGIIHIYIYI